MTRRYSVNVNQVCELNASEETETYTVYAQSESEAKHKAREVAAARQYTVKRFNWVKCG